MRKVLSRITLTAVVAVTTLVPLAVTSASAGAPGHTECIVSLSPTATTTLFKLGAGPNVVAVDKDSNFPLHGLPSKRIDPFNPNAEAIATICKVTATHPSPKPSFVVISYDANKIKEKLIKLGIVVILQNAPTSLKGVYHQIEKLGWMSRHRRAAHLIVANLKSRIAFDVASVLANRHGHQGLTAYYELDPNLYSLTSSTFVGGLLRSLGVVNIADKVDRASDYGYPQLSREYVVSTNPQLILLADTICCKASQKSVASRPGFAHMSAVVHHHVVSLDDNLASQWGWRLGDLMDALQRGVNSAYGDATIWKR